MRWIAIVLVLLNAIYWGWLQLGQANEQKLSAKTDMKLYAEQVQRLEVVTVTEPTPVDEPVKVVQEVAEVIEDCWLIGPFEEAISVDQVRGRLKALSIDFPVRETEVETSRDYWVYLAPKANRKSALKLLRELQGKKIDSFLVTEGELANGISLGLFTQKERAERVREQRIEQGYDAEIKEVPRTLTQVWGLYDGRKYGPLMDELWANIREGNKNLERYKKICNKIASLDQFD